MKKIGLVIAVAASLLVVGASTARADEASSARDHYNRGSTLFDLGRFGEAAREFEAAYEAKNDPALLYNLGQAYRADGNVSKALVAYRAFLRKSPDIGKARRAEVEARIAELQHLVDEQKSVGTRPPTGTLPPGGSNEPGGTTTGMPAPPAERPVSPALVATPTAPAPKAEPLYKKWWLWTAVGVVVAGAAVGTAVAVTTPKDANLPSGATAVSFH
jgi:tetratricopeptide (TPR) repeat protein